MNRQSFVLGLICLGVFAFRINTAAAGELIGTFGPVTIEARHTTISDLPGFTRWTLSAGSDLPIRGFDFSGERGTQFGDPVAYGFFGPMNQLPSRGVESVFFCGCILGPDVRNDLDSQFPVRTAELVIPAGFASESATHLRAIFASQNPFQNPIDFVQLVIPNGSEIDFLGKVVVGPIDALQEITVFGTIPPIPEPASIVLAGCALFVAGSVRRRAGYV